MAFHITLKHWHAVAEWTWNEGEDVCGICRTAYDGCAPDVKYPGDDSPVVWGSCGHAFHLQCIQKWLASSSEHRCPMCRRGWRYKGAGGADDQQGDDVEGSPEGSDVDQEQQQPEVEGEMGEEQEEDVDIVSADAVEGEELSPLYEYDQLQYEQHDGELEGGMFAEEEEEDGVPHELGFPQPYWGMNSRQQLQPQYQTLPIPPSAYAHLSYHDVSGSIPSRTAEADMSLGGPQQGRDSSRSWPAGRRGGAASTNESDGGAGAHHQGAERRESGRGGGMMRRLDLGSDDDLDLDTSEDNRI